MPAEVQGYFIGVFSPANFILIFLGIFARAQLYEITAKYRSSKINPDRADFGRFRPKSGAKIIGKKVKVTIAESQGYDPRPPTPY